MSQSQPAVDNSNTSRKFAFSVSADELSATYATHLQSKQKSAKVKGFRPGKVPLRVVGQMYGKSVLTAVAQNIANQRIREAQQSLIDENVNLVSVGEVDNWPEREDADWKFEISFDVIPPFDLPDLASVKATLIKSEITAADIDTTLEKMRHKYPEYQDVDEAIKSGSSARLDMVYQLATSDESAPTLNEESFSGIPNTEFSGAFMDERWQIDDSLPVKGMESAMKGMKAGDSKAMQLVIDDTFVNNRWRGKTMYMFVRIHKVQKQLLPEIDAAFAETLGVKDIEGDAVTELRERVKKDIEIRLRATLETANKERLFMALVQATSIELPQSLIDSYNANTRRNFALQYMTPEKIKSVEKPEDLFQPELFAEKAIEHARTSEIMNRLVKDNNIETNQDEVRSVIMAAASEYDNPEEFMQRTTQNREEMAHYVRIALEHKVYDWLREHCEITWEEMSTDDVFAGKYRPAAEGADAAAGAAGTEDKKSARVQKARKK